MKHFGFSFVNDQDGTTCDVKLALPPDDPTKPRRPFIDEAVVPVIVGHLGTMFEVLKASTAVKGEIQASILALVGSFDAEQKDMFFHFFTSHLRSEQQSIVMKLAEALGVSTASVAADEKPRENDPSVPPEEVN